MSLFTTVSAVINSLAKLPSCVVQQNRGIVPSKEPNSVVERERAPGLRMRSGEVTSAIRREGTVDEERLLFESRGETDFAFFGVVLSRLAGGP